MFVLFLVNEEFWKINVEFFVFPGQSCRFDDDLVGGGVEVLGGRTSRVVDIRPLFCVEVLRRLFTGILRRLRSRSLRT